MGLDKRISSAEEALERAGVFDGATIMMGGFGLCGIPEHLIAALRKRGTKDLTVISNNAGVDGFGIGILLETKQVRKMISSYVGENKLFETQLLGGELDVELTPQGTLAERIRAGGAGIRAFFTPTGVGTLVAEGKEERAIDGVDCVLETALRADFSFIKGHRADHWGNVAYRKTARNFNPMMATAGKTVIVEVEEIVEVGMIEPDQVATPAVYVDYVLQGDQYEKRIEQRTTRPASS